MYVNVCVFERVRKLEKQEKIRKIYKHSQLQILKLLPLQDWLKAWETHRAQLIAAFSCQLSRYHGTENLKKHHLRKWICKKWWWGILWRSATYPLTMWILLFVLSSFWVVSAWIDTFGSSHWVEIFCVNSVLTCSPLDIHLQASWRSLPLILDLYCRSESWPEWNSEYTQVHWPVLFEP